MQAAAEKNILATHLVPGFTLEKHADTLKVRRDQTCLNESFEKVFGQRGDSDILSMKQEVMSDIFAYDPEDSADEWWLKWGLVQERLEGGRDDITISSLVNVLSIQES